jgi:hypothetical protein
VDEPLVAEAPVVAEEPVVADAPVVAEEPVVADAPVVAEEPIAADAAIAASTAASTAEDTSAWPVADLQHSTKQALDAAVLLALAHDDARPAESAGPDEVVVEIQAQPEPIPVPEPVAAAPEPEPVAAAPAPEPQPEHVVAEPEPEPETVAAEPRTDVVPQPTWPTPTAPTSQPVAAPTPTPAPEAVPWLMVAPAEEAARGEPQWPATPVWRAGARNTDAPTTLAGRTLLPQPDASALWAASAQQVLSGTPADVAAAAAVAQPCVQCGLSLSANARFCRRCGTRQA